jgi:predicted GIY-YIG superfamily endonuclease
MPTATDVALFKSVQVLIAPNGCKIAPADDVSSEDLINEGWRHGVVPTTPDRPHPLRHGIQGKRKQYALKHRIAITIHASMGQDLGSLATKVTLPTTDPRYSLWLASQVVVLLSRTFYAKDIHFIGPVEETTNALVHALRIQSQYSEYMSRLMDYLTGQSLHPTDVHSQVFDVPRFFPFRMSDLPIPNDTSGVVYLLISLRDFRTTYIGQTQRLNDRLKKHNSRHGSVQTADPSLQPWALLCIICGFESNVTNMRIVEAAWERQRTDLTTKEGPLSPDTVCNIGKQLVTRHPYRRLRFFLCGTLNS